VAGACPKLLPAKAAPATQGLGGCRVRRGPPGFSMHLSIGGQCDANHRMRPRNADLRRREYLTEAEVERLMEAAKNNRWGLRDASMVLVAYRHGLRAAELVDLRWDQVDFGTATCTSAGSRRARLKIVAPVEVITRGVDLPLSFPLKSYTKHWQQSLQDCRKADQNDKNLEQICQPSVAHESIDQIEEECADNDDDQHV